MTYHLKALAALDMDFVPSTQIEPPVTPLIVELTYMYHMYIFSHTFIYIK